MDLFFILSSGNHLIILMKILFDERSNLVFNQENTFNTLFFRPKSLLVSTKISFVTTNTDFGCVSQH
jgi:hypothetical protein